MGRDRIDVRRIGLVGKVGPGPSGLIHQVLDQEVGTFNALTTNDGCEGIKPFAGFFWIGIVLQLEVLIHSEDCTLGVKDDRKSNRDNVGL